MEFWGKGIHTKCREILTKENTFVEEEVSTLEGMDQVLQPNPLSHKESQVTLHLRK